MPLTARHIFLTGQPGVGKTTLAVAAVRAVPEGSCCGFYTEERRSASGDRVGFDVVVLGSNARGPLANLGGGKPLVGKYSVNVPSFEELALPSLDASSSSAVTLIDEVGKMELYSERFLPKVEALLAADGCATVLGTLPMPRYGHKIAPVERIRDAPDVAVVKLLKHNRDAAAAAVKAVIEAAAKRGQPGAPMDVTPLAEFLQEGQAEKLLGTHGGGCAGRGAGGVGDDRAAAASDPPPAKRQQRDKPPSPRLSAGTQSKPVPAPPLLVGTPRVLLLGETASPCPAEGALPYAERSMWPVLRVALGLSEDVPLADVQRAAVEAGIAVWDVLQNVHLKKTRGGGNGGGAGSSSSRGGNTNDHPDAARPNDVPALLAAHAIGRVAFIGAKAHKAFLCHHPQLAPTVELCILPSSSRANAQPVASKAAEWRRVLL